jgi:hypothetical protein
LIIKVLISNQDSLVIDISKNKPSSLNTPQPQVDKGLLGNSLVIFLPEQDQSGIVPGGGNSARHGVDSNSQVGVVSCVFSLTGAVNTVAVDLTKLQDVASSLSSEGQSVFTKSDVDVISSKIIPGVGVGVDSNRALVPDPDGGGDIAPSSSGAVNPIGADVEEIEFFGSLFCCRWGTNSSDGFSDRF